MLPYSILFCCHSPLYIFFYLVFPAIQITPFVYFKHTIPGDFDCADLMDVRSCSLCTSKIAV